MIAVGVLGALCVAVVNLDVLWTVVAAGAGGGPLTSRLGNFLWFVAPRATSPRRHRVLQVAGPAITVTIIAVWIGLLILGWFLIFSATPGAVVSSTTGEPADVWSRLYFTGFTVFTLGTGDYVPGESFWQLATVAATGTGLTLVTLAITYMLSVITSVTQRRQLGSQISAIGVSPLDVLGRAWDGSSLDSLSDVLQPLPSDLADLAQRHLAFPVLHYFHSPERDTAIAPSVVTLDEVLTLLEHAVAPGHRLPELTTAQVRDSLTELLRRATDLDAGRPTSPPELETPWPSLDRVRALGVPVVDEREWYAALEALASRRRKLGQLLAIDGWDWDAVWTPPEQR